MQRDNKSGVGKAEDGNHLRVSVADAVDALFGGDEGHKDDVIFLHSVIQQQPKFLSDNKLVGQGGRKRLGQEVLIVDQEPKQRVPKGHKEGGTGDDHGVENDDIGLIDVLGETIKEQLSNSK